MSSVVYRLSVGISYKNRKTIKYIKPYNVIFKMLCIIINLAIDIKTYKPTNECTNSIHVVLVQ